jgi:perosamine synthetase
MLNLVPPAGSPVPVSFLLKSVFWQSKSKGEPETLVNSICKEYNIKHCYLLNSGRSALYYILRAMNHMADKEKHEVIIPAYTCFSVPSAIVKAGLKIRPVDINPSTMDYDYERLEQHGLGNALALISCNLFGIISDIKKLEVIARENQMYLIDDAAQSMGSKNGLRYSGTFGDAGIFSLGRGKNITAYEGGILVTDNDLIAGQIAREIDMLEKASSWQEIKAFNKLLSYSLFLRPALYWLPSRVSFLHLGETVFDPDFELSCLSQIQKTVSELMFTRVSSLNAVRKKNAIKIGRALLNNGNYSIPGYAENNCPAYIRLPVICPDRGWRNSAIEKLRKVGISATAMYPSGIHQIPGIQPHLGGIRDDYPGTRIVVDRLLTIPTHPYLKESHIDIIISTLVEIN